MTSKQEIISGIYGSAKDVIQLILQQEDKKFSLGPEGRWMTAQHLDHLRKSAEMLNKALNIPKFILRYKFGKPNRPVRSFDEIIEKYQGKVQAFAGKTFEESKGEAYGVDQKAEQLQRFEKQIDRLCRSSDRWSDAKMNNYLIPHPLLGRMHVREILMWCIYHHQHHLNILKRDYL